MRFTLIASVHPHMLTTFNMTSPTFKISTVSCKLNWSLVMGELWITRIYRWKELLTLSKQAMAWYREDSIEKQPGFSERRISSSFSKMDSISKVRSEAILQKPLEARPSAANAKGVDYLSTLRYYLIDITAAANLEGLKSFMPIDLVTSRMMTTALIVCTMVGYLLLLNCSSCCLYCPSVINLSTSSNLLSFFIAPIYNSYQFVSLWF